MAGALEALERLQLQKEKAVYFRLPFQTQKSIARILRHLVEQLLARLFEHLDYEIETLSSLVVGVGHIVVTLSVGGKIVTHTIDFIDGLSCRSQAYHSFVVAVIHYDDAVEVVEIANTKWARAVGKAVATTMRSLTHTGIRQLTSVTGVGAGGVYLELLAKTTSKNLLTENLLRHRRTADISEADEEYFVFHNVFV